MVVAARHFYRRFPRSAVGEGASGLSASTISRLKVQWLDENGDWAQRDLCDSRYAYLWAWHLQQRETGRAPVPAGCHWSHGVRSPVEDNTQTTTNRHRGIGCHRQNNFISWLPEKQATQYLLTQM